MALVSQMEMGAKANFGFLPHSTKGSTKESSLAALEKMHKSAPLLGERDKEEVFGTIASLQEAIKHDAYTSAKRAIEVQKLIVGLECG
jgi:hypothetical protein